MESSRITKTKVPEANIFATLKKCNSVYVDFEKPPGLCEVTGIIVPSMNFLGMFFAYDDSTLKTKQVTNLTGNFVEVIFRHIFWYINKSGFSS